MANQSWKQGGKNRRRTRACNIVTSPQPRHRPEAVRETTVVSIARVRVHHKGQGDIRCFTPRKRDALLHPGQENYNPPAVPRQKDPNMGIHGAFTPAPPPSHRFRVLHQGKSDDPPPSPVLGTLRYRASASLRARSRADPSSPHTFTIKLAAR